MLLTFTLTLAIADVASSSSISIPGPGPLTRLTRSVPLLLVFLLLGLPVSVEHDRMDIAELRLDNPRYPLKNIHLWRLDLVVLDRWEVLRLHVLGLRVRVHMQGLSHAIMRKTAHWGKVGIYNHRIFRLGDLSPIRESTIIPPFTTWRRLLGELIRLRGIIVDRHGRRVVALEVTVHFGNVRNGGIVTH